MGLGGRCLFLLLISNILADENVSVWTPTEFTGEKTHKRTLILRKKDASDRYDPWEFPGIPYACKPFEKGLVRTYYAANLVPWSPIVACFVFPLHMARTSELIVSITSGRRLRVPRSSWYH